MPPSAVLCVRLCSGGKIQEEEEVASENGSEAEDIRESDNDTENDSEETESNSHETSSLRSCLLPLSL